MLSPLSPSPTPLPELLLVDTDVTAGRHLPVLREHYRVAVASTASAALQALTRSAPALVVTELDLRDGPGEDVCRRAKMLPTPATVLVTTPTAERVPRALAAGCDGVLLKPFAPNLLYARIGRLLRARTLELRLRTSRHGRPAYVADRADPLAARTNRDWPDTCCPWCQHQGVTSFEHTSHRRSWYACLACQKVWIAPRRE